MLTLDQLKKNYTLEQIKKQPKNILVEYLQYELLDSIYKEKESADLSFIGGTAVRIVYGSSRFSEDLDFDNFGLSFETFQTLLEKVVKDMRLKGFEIEFRFIEKGAYHCYVRFPNILYAQNLSNHKDEKILVRIDTVNKDKNLQPTIYNLNKFDIYRDILVNPADIILAQKLITALQRHREKGRDFYDISYLYGLTEPNFDYIKSYLNLGKNIFADKLLKKCEELNFNQLAEDVEPFLFKKDNVARVLDFKNFIVNKFQLMK